MGKKLQKVKALLGRIQFIDLAGAIAVPNDRRKDHLRGYLDRAMIEARMPSYEHFRRLVPDIYGVERPLDPSPSMSLSDIQDRLKRTCHSSDLDRNQNVAALLFGFVRARGYRTYDHPAHDLYLSTTRRAQIRINQFVVDGDRGVFQYVYPRTEELYGTQLQVMFSLIHHNYVQGDYIDSAVEIVDLSCPVILGPRGGRRTTSTRQPRIQAMMPTDLISLSDLQPEVQSVHDLLIEIGQEPDDAP